MRADVECVVYQVTNLVNGKRYIGASKYGAAKRWARHVAMTRTDGARYAFQRAIMKYGPESFTVETLATCADFQEALARERIFIADLRPEYNMTRGGDGVLGLVHSEDSRAKMSASHKGQVPVWSLDPEKKAAVGAKISATNKGKKKAKPKSAETRLQMSLARKGKRLRWRDDPEKAASSARKHAERCKGKMLSWQTDPEKVAIAMAKRIATRTGKKNSPEATENIRAGAAWRRKSVMRLSDGKIYETALAASMESRLSQWTIKRDCKNSGSNSRFSYVKNMGF